MDRGPQDGSLKRRKAISAGDVEVAPRQAKPAEYLVFAVLFVPFVAVIPTLVAFIEDHSAPVDIGGLLWMALYVVTAMCAPALILSFMIGPRLELQDRIQEVLDRSNEADDRTEQVVPETKEMASDHLAWNVSKDKMIDGVIKRQRRAKARAAQAIAAISTSTYAILLIAFTVINAVAFLVVFERKKPLPFIDLGSVDQLILDTSTSLLLGYAGAWLASLFMLITRYSSNDITPRFVLSLCCQLIVGGAIGYVVGTVPVEGDLSIWEKVLPFAAGFVPYGEIVDFFKKKGRHALYRSDIDRDHVLAKASVDDDLTSIQGISAAERERLEEEGIRAIQHIGLMDPFHIFLLTNYSIVKIIDWCDQALLILYVGSDQIPKLRPFGIRGVIDFAESLVRKGLSREELAKAAGFKDETALMNLLEQVRYDPIVIRIGMLWYEFSAT